MESLNQDVEQVEYQCANMEECGVLVSDSDREHALAQLKAEKSAVGDAQGGASGFGEVAGQHGSGAMPCPGAAAKLPDVVEGRACTRTGNTLKYQQSCDPTATVLFWTVLLLLTRVQISHYIDAGSNRHSTVDEGRAGLDTQILVIKEHPPVFVVPKTKSQAETRNLLSYYH